MTLDAVPNAAVQFMKSEDNGWFIPKTLNSPAFMIHYRIDVSKKSNFEVEWCS